MIAAAAVRLSEGELDRLRKVSRRAMLLSALGAVIVMAALLIASYQLSQVEAQQKQASTALAQTRAQLEETRTGLARAQCALRESRSAIEAFHSGAYDVAVGLYDEALRCDPQNAYLLNLKAYSLFKAGRLAAAIDAQQQSLSVDSGYAWGYFDLARFQCAARAFDKAAAARSTAIRLRPDLAEVMRSDGEFMRLCKAIL